MLRNTVSKFGGRVKGCFYSGSNPLSYSQWSKNGGKKIEGLLANEVGISSVISRNFHQSCVDCGRYYESNKRGEYKDRKLHHELDNYYPKSIKDVKQNFNDIRAEIRMWANEWKERLGDDTKGVVTEGDKEKLWHFTSKDSLAKWDTLCDSDHNEGFSRCELTISPSGKALFHGFVNTTPPKDGRVRKAGYCVMKSKRPVKSFQRDAYFDWDDYTHLIMRIRGDGRTYALNIATAGFYDITWNDNYHYVLFTRGGPYWQYVKIPFSKFLFGSKGRVQDYQERIPLEKVCGVQINAAKVDGPFCLEVDYIGVEKDSEKMEHFAYEEYKVPKFIVNT